MSTKTLLKYACSVSILLILWMGLSLALQTPALPDPAAAFCDFVRAFDKICVHVSISLVRVICTMIISVAAGVPLGLAIGRYGILNYLFSPLLYMIYPIPKIALLPVVMLVFGLGDISKVLLIFIVVFFQIIVTCRDEAARIKKEQFFFLKSIGSTEFQVFRHLIFPQSLPAIFTSIRLSLGTSLAVLFFSENYGTQYGIGYFIIDSWMRVDYTEMFAGIIGLSLLGILFFLLTDLLERKICPWK